MNRMLLIHFHKHSKTLTSYTFSNFFSPTNTKKSFYFMTLAGIIKNLNIYSSLNEKVYSGSSQDR